MASRTAEGKHTTRFIILTKGYEGLVWTRSISMPGFYATKEEAQNAIREKQEWFPEYHSKFARSKATSYARQWLSATSQDSGSTPLASTG